MPFNESPYCRCCRKAEFVTPIRHPHDWKTDMSLGNGVTE